MEDKGIKEYDCFFTFKTIVQTHGRDKEGALENIEKILDKGILEAISMAMCCGTDYERKMSEDMGEEIKNGWFELPLFWSGYWTMEAKNEKEAEEKAKEFLDERLTPFYTIFEHLSDDTRRFYFKELKGEQIANVLNYRHL